MPSSELPRIRLWHWAHSVSLFESLLLGMPRTCLKRQNKSGINIVQTGVLCTLYTGSLFPYGNTGLFIQKLVTVYTQFIGVYTRDIIGVLKCNTSLSTHHPQCLYIQLNKGLY